MVFRRKKTAGWQMKQVSVSRSNPRLGRVRFDNTVVCVDVVGVAVDQIDIRVRPEELKRGLQGSRVVHVVGIDPADHLAAGSLKALIDGIRLPPSFRDTQRIRGS